MAEQIIIAIGREFGSGGHEIAEKLSELYGIKLYDKNILQNIAEAKNVDVASYEKYDEVPKKMIFSRTVKGLSNSMEENSCSSVIWKTRQMPESLSLLSDVVQKPC